jgi:glutaminyl-peptide cyclotransferase
MVRTDRDRNRSRRPQGLALVPLFLCACHASPDLSLVPTWRLEVKRTFDHQGDRLFTEGLVLGGGYLYESTGLATALRKIDPATGSLLVQKNLDELGYFGEGLTVWKDRLVQLSYQSNRACLFTLDFEKLPEEFTYSTEGWGLTQDGEHLIMSDGSDELTFRDPDTFAVVRTVEAQVDGVGVDRLNELEYVDGNVFANRYLEKYIVIISARSGEVVGKVDGTSLACSQIDGFMNALNGIAHDPKTGLFYLTGKNCAKIQEVELSPE